MVQLSPFN